ncbi:MAG: MBL fold metallo-hydrolase [Clostridiales bacterium]|nr:MBL fold metallo-hydrolase [Clostridiales bacterium]
MKLHILGCHGPFPGAEGATSGYLIEHKGQAILMDCGSGVLGRLMKKWDPKELSGIVMSHLHFDHACDLLVLRYYLEKMGKQIKVYVPGEDQSPFRALLESSAFEVLPYPEKLTLAGLDITSFPVRHPVPCRAIRFTDGEKTLVFTGDTNNCDGLSDFAKGANVLLADGAFLESEWNEKLPHMSAAGTARLAVEAKAERLYVTHLPIHHAPETLENEAKAIFPHAQAVKPGMVISL